MPHSGADTGTTADANAPSPGVDGAIVQLRVRGPDGSVKSVSVARTLPPQALLSAAAQEFGIAPAIAATTTQLLAGFPPRPLELSTAATIGELPVTARDMITLRVDQKAANAAAAEAKKVLSGKGDGCLVRREMPSDNSCLFRAVAYCVYNRTREDIYVKDLRSLVAETILVNPDTFSSAILGKDPMDYCIWINDSKSWGGGIELSALSMALGIQISAYDIVSKRKEVYGSNNEDAKRQCLVLYDGIHYDALAMRGSDPGEKNDTTMFPVETSDDSATTAAMVDEMAQQLLEVLHRQRQFTDVGNFALRCIECGAGLTGEKEATEHARTKGHTSFAEF